MSRYRMQLKEHGFDAHGLSAPGLAGWVYSILLLLTTFPLSAAEVDTVAKQYIAQALQGDLSEAGALFNDLTKNNGSSLDLALAEQFRHRFIAQDEDDFPESGNPFMDQLLTIYRDYWTQSLLGEMDAEEGTEWLENSLNNYLIKHNYIASLENHNDILSKLESVIHQEGFYAERSLAPPWQDLILWKTQQIKSYDIELTEKVQTVDVVFMDDFLSIGWSDFATLGMTSTGGWAAADALYCVSWAWNQDSENFQVSYLKHEGRHFADFDLFPNLRAIDLEYRAKLTELAYASSTLPRLLTKFTANGSANPESPHAFANYRVIRDLYQVIFKRAMPETGNPWEWVRADRVNPAARSLLDTHTKLLDKDGALITQGVLTAQVQKLPMTQH